VGKIGESMGVGGEKGGATEISPDKKKTHEWGGVWETASDIKKGTGKTEGRSEKLGGGKKTMQGSRGGG